MIRLLLAVVLLGSACSQVPALRALPEFRRAEAAVACESALPRGAWRMVHSIQATFPGGHSTLVIGVSVWDPDTRRLDSALMTPEGMVLFRGGSDDDGVSVDRALPPLDRPGFAEGLFRDVGFLFIPPEGPPDLLGGRNGDGVVCRWSSGDRILDVGLPPDGGRHFREYVDGRLVREAVFEDGPPARVDLRIHGALGYRMVMTRIR